MKHFSFLFLFLLSSFSVAAQDTVTVMHYNLLFFPSGGNNRMDDLGVILQYEKPDIFMCCEMETHAGARNILDSALNVGAINYYDSAAFVDGYDTDNMLYYNSNKLTLASQNQLTTALRDISHYQLFSCGATDTVWYDLFEAHLKASSGTSNANARLAEVTILTNYIATLPANTNIIFGGDFNFYSVMSSIEPAWNQLTVNCVQPFKDPINMAGEWHSNVVYKSIHTQATRSTTNPGCCGGVTGGLDDRFDFLLINQNLRDGLAGAQYIPGTYKVVGNDGNHFNKAIVETPVNTSVPAAVNTALFNMSDHLPVVMKVYTCDATIGIEENVGADHVFISFPNQEEILINANYLKEEKLIAEVLSINGSVICSSNFISVPGNNQFLLHTPFMEKGMYILRLTSASGTIVKKFVK
jgi:hypothetical protein